MKHGTQSDPEPTPLVNSSHHPCLVEDCGGYLEVKYDRGHDSVWCPRCCRVFEAACLIHVIPLFWSRVAAAYVEDRAKQYVTGSGIVGALEDLAAELREGEHFGAFGHGELDDLLAWRAKFKKDQEERIKTRKGSRR